MRSTLFGLVLFITLMSTACSAAQASGDDAGRSDLWANRARKWGQLGGRSDAAGRWADWNIGERRTINWDGLERVYYVHIPQGYNPDAPAPVVLNFHGGGSNAKQQAFASGMIRKSNREGFIAVHPEGTGERMLRWNGGPHADREGVDDVGFVGAMLDALEAEFNVDPKRIFATGISSGGFMSYRLACEMAGRIAAIAPVAAMHDFECEPSAPVAIIHFHGTADEWCPYRGGKGLLLNYPFRSVDDAIDFWVEYNRCSREYEITYQSGDATCYEYRSSLGVDVVLCRIDGGGHNWPGGRGAGRDLRVLGYCTDDISATDAMWEFFTSHPKSR